MIKAEFIGQDKSMGYRKGVVYEFSTKIFNDYLFILPKGMPRVPYSSLETFLNNWRIL